MRRFLRLARATGLVAPATLLLLLSPAVSRAADPITDPIGDAQPDIVSVSARADGDAVVLIVELADDWPGDRPTGLFVWVETGSTAGCIGWTAEYVIEGGAIAPGVDAPPEARVVALEYTIDGRTLTMTIPLSAIGDPEQLLLHVRAPDDVPDDEAGCISLPLRPEPVPPDTAVSSTTGNASLVMAGVAFVLIAGLLLRGRARS